jgi:hypothetical protein
MRSREGGAASAASAAAPAQDAEALAAQRRSFTDADDAELSSALSARISQVTGTFDEAEAAVGPASDEPEPLQGERRGSRPRRPSALQQCNWLWSRLLLLLRRLTRRAAPASACLLSPAQPRSCATSSSPSTPRPTTCPLCGATCPASPS